MKQAIISKINNTIALAATKLTAILMAIKIMINIGNNDTINKHG